MNTTRTAWIAVLVGLILVIGVWRAGPPREQPQPGIHVLNEFSSRELSDDKAAAASEGNLVSTETDPLLGLVGEGLNSVDGNAADDVEILTELFHAWQTNFPGQGNPVGLNAEITRALTGQNPLRLELIPPDHPAINETGQLVDRWGTPFEFHQISGAHMEIRSAGPDRVLYTADDVVGNPGPEF